jgi:hypothetical protein
VIVRSPFARLPRRSAAPRRPRCVTRLSFVTL